MEFGIFMGYYVWDICIKYPVHIYNSTKGQNVTLNIKKVSILRIVQTDTILFTVCYLISLNRYYYIRLLLIANDVEISLSVSITLKLSTQRSVKLGVLKGRWNSKSVGVILWLATAERAFPLSEVNQYDSTISLEPNSVTMRSSNLKGTLVQQLLFN